MSITMTLEIDGHVLRFRYMPDEPSAYKWLLL